MNLYPSSFWFDGVCFKCTHYTHRHCTKHDTDIQGDCGHKCDDYKLSQARWFNETIQRWEHDRGLDWTDEPTQATNPQTDLTRWL